MVAQLSLSLRLGLTPASGPFSRVTTGVTGNCVTALAPGAVCTIRDSVHGRLQRLARTSTGSVAITGSASVTNAPVALSGTSVTVVRSVSAGPNPLAFGTWASTTTSPPQTVTVLNTGNVAVTGLTYATAGPGFSPATGAGSGGTCTATLNAGDSCTVNRVFAPTSATAYSGTLTVAGTGITSQVVQLAGGGYRCDRRSEHVTHARYTDHHAAQRGTDRYRDGHAEEQPPGWAADRSRLRLSLWPMARVETC